MDEERNKDNIKFRYKEIEKKFFFRERDSSPLSNFDNKEQKEISSKMNKILSIMYDDNFVLMINELSSSIKKFHKEMNQNFVEINRVIQIHLEMEENSNNINMNKENNNLSKSNLINIFNNIQKSFCDFYAKAKIVFKKMKNYRNEKLKHINESANELQNNKFLKLCFSKNDIYSKDDKDKFDTNKNFQSIDLNENNILTKNKILLFEKSPSPKDKNEANESNTNIFKSSISNCVMNKILITDIKLLLNILKLEKMSNDNHNINSSENKSDLFNKKEDLIKKINQEIEQIPEKNILNNINPYITNNNIILSNNNINNNNFIQQNDNLKYEKEKKELFEIIENLNKENNKLKEENLNYNKMNENLTSKLNKVTLKQELSCNMESKIYKEEIEKYYKNEIVKIKDEYEKNLEKVKKDMILLEEEKKKIDKKNENNILEIEQLNKENMINKNKLNIIKNKLKETDEELILTKNGLNKEKNDLIKEKLNIENKLNEEIKKLKEENNNQRINNEEIINSLKNDLDKLNQDKNNLQNEKDNIVISFNKKINDINSEKNNLIKEKQKIENSLNINITKIKQEKNNILENEKLINSLKKNIEELNTEKNKLNKEKEKLELSLQNKKDELNEEIINLKKENDNLKNNILEKDNCIKELQEKKEENRLIAQENQELIKQITELNNKNINLSKEKEDLEKDNNKKIEEYNILFKENQELLQENLELKNQIKEFEEINSNLNIKIEKHGEEIIQYNTELKKQKNLINELNKKILNLKDKNNEYDNEVLNLNNKISQLNINIEEKNNLINKYFINIKEEQNKKIILEEKNKDLLAKISRLQNDLDKIIEKKQQYNTINTNSNIDKDTIINQKEHFYRRFRRLHTSKTNNNDLKYNDLSDHGKTINTLSSYNFKNKTNTNLNNVPKIKTEIIDFTPDNYIIVNSFKLTNTFKWLLFKKNKNKNSFPTKRYSSNLHLRKNLRQFNRNKSNDPKKHADDFSNTDETNINNNYDNDSFSDFVWKPQRNRKEFLEFESIINNNDSINKDKKIEELEKNIKNLEDKLDKKEKDFNRVNMTYAKLFNRNKNPENNIDKLLDEIEKLKKENKNLNININKLKSEHNFIGLSFIADDLEGSQFIDDKCFGEILNGLDKNNSNNNNYIYVNENKNKYKEKKNEKKEINYNYKDYANNYNSEKKERDKEKEKIIDSYRTNKINKYSRKDKEYNVEKKEINNENNKENVNRPIYRRFYKSRKGKDYHSNQNDNQ